MATEPRKSCKRPARFPSPSALRILEPIWSKKPETASRLRGRIERILDYARVRGYRSGENPALWRGHLDKLLPSAMNKKTREHHAALPYDELPAFVRDLRQQGGNAARALEYSRGPSSSGRRAPRGGYRLRFTSGSTIRLGALEKPLEGMSVFDAA
jgi:integrase